MPRPIQVHWFAAMNWRHSFGNEITDGFSYLHSVVIDQSVRQSLVIPLLSAKVRRRYSRDRIGLLIHWPPLLVEAAGEPPLEWRRHR
jgi:hypothetical protein